MTVAYYIFTIFLAVVSGIVVVVYLRNRFLGIYLYSLLFALLKKDNEIQKEQNKLFILKFWRLTKAVFVFIPIYFIAVWVSIPRLLILEESYLSLFDTAIATVLLVIGWGELKLFLTLRLIIREIKNSK